MIPASGELRGKRDEVAEAANVLARLGLVTAYGHVSARGGTSMLITPAADLALVTASAVLEVPLHGQAAWLGESVPVHDGAVLLRSFELAESAARSLPAGEALLLRGNGALTLGATAGVAVARMWLLSAACQVYLTAAAAAGSGPVTPLSAEEVASWRAVRDELLPRLWQHLRRRGEPGSLSPVVDLSVAREEESEA